MTDKQPEALRLADAPDQYREWSLEDVSQICALLRTQHAAIERKDALLRRALETLENHEGNYKLTAAECDVVIAVQDAITSELAK